MLELGM